MTPAWEMSSSTVASTEMGTYCHLMLLLDCTPAGISGALTLVAARFTTFQHATRDSGSKCHLHQPLSGLQHASVCEA